MDIIIDFRNRLVGFYNLLSSSDTQTGYSPPYVWLADQFGHMFIGFGGLFFALWAVAPFFGPVPGYALSSNRADGRKALSRGLIWAMAFLLLVLYIAKEIGLDLSVAGGRGEALWLENRAIDLWQDCLTDIAFVAIGLALALAHFGALRVHPVLVFVVAFAAAVWLVWKWQPVFEKLERAKVPFLARMSTVNLTPAAPAGSTGSAPAETSALQEQSRCKPYKQQDESSQSGKPLQCVTQGTCTKTHFVIYGLTDEDLPQRSDRASRTILQRSLSPFAQMAPQLQDGRLSKEDIKIANNIRRTLRELRRLGAALPAEHVFREGRGEIYFDTLYSFIGDQDEGPGVSVREGVNLSEATTLVIDNIEHDLMMFLLKEETPPGEIVSALEKLFGAKAGSLIEKLSLMTVVWLSFNEHRAIDLCNALAQHAGPEGQVILARAKPAWK